MPSNIVSNPHLAGLASLHRGGGVPQVAEIHYIYKKTSALIHHPRPLFFSQYYSQQMMLGPLPISYYCIYMPMLGTVAHQSLLYPSADTLPSCLSVLFIISCIRIRFKTKPIIDFSTISQEPSLYYLLLILCYHNNTNNTLSDEVVNNK